MDEFPDPEDEYELMYGDDLEAVRELEEQTPRVDFENDAKSRRSLDFSSPAVRKTLSRFPDHSAHDSQDAASSTAPQEGLDMSGIDANTSTHQKRSLEELFGDIGDLEWQETEKPCKRQRVEDADERDRRLVERIRDLRRHKRLAGLVPSHTPADALTHARSDNFSFTIPRWPCFPLTRSNGDKVYVRLHSEEFMEKEVNAVTKCHKGFKSLLGNQFNEIMEEAKLYLEGKCESVSSRQEVEESSVSAASEEGELWVQRYRPQSYCDLLSDEATNRALLRWLKMWDKVVFNREVKLKTAEKKSSFNKRSGKFEFGRESKEAAESEPPLDQHGRPYRSLVLLCGPPGCGKTTLAHLLARHAGYNVVEVNASDDRNVESFKNALENSTQMKSVLDLEKRPNCLVLDEIDGAPLPVIELLVKFMSSNPAGGKAKGRPRVARRPVICICNDPHGAALRPLRRAALVLRVPPAGAGRLAERLALVWRREGLRPAPDPPLLAALALRTDSDIRACLTILNFCKSKGKMLKLADLDKINIGHKDMAKGLFQVWKEVFQILPAGEEGKGGSARLLRSVHSAGDLDRLVQGVFENYLVRGGVGLAAVCGGLEWFATYDRLSSHIASTQNYSLYPYLPYAFASWHLHFARMAWSNINYPKIGFEMHQRRVQLDGVVCSVQRGVCARLQPWCSRRALRLDALPLLPHILSPALRPVGVQLYSERERRALAALVGVMLDYSLHYTQQKLQDSSYTYVLDPDIMSVGVFEEKTSSVRNLTYAMKQLIAREVDLEGIRRVEGGGGGAAAGRLSESAPPSAPATLPLPNHLQRLEPKKMTSDIPLVMKDFFGRSVACSPASAARKAGKTDDIVKSAVWYHYKEGFNNAVRRDVKISDLL